MSPTPVIWIAHRGASLVAPENTLAAIAVAVRRRAHGVEFDVRGTRDGRLVLMHDDSLDRTTTGSGKVRDLTLRQIRRADAGIKKAKKFAGERVPTLREALRLLKGRATPVIEVKDTDISDAVVSDLRRSSMVGEAVIISFHDSVLQAVASIEPRLSLSLLVGPDREPDADAQAQALVARAREVGANGLDLAHTSLSKPLATAIRRRSMALWVWTVNDAARAAKLVSMGVDAITTDAVRLRLPER